MTAQPDADRTPLEALVRLIGVYRAAKSGDTAGALMGALANPSFQGMSRAERQQVGHVLLLVDRVVETAAGLAGVDADRLWAGVSASLLDRG